MNVIKVLATLRPGLNCQPKPGLSTAAHIDDVQFDAPLPEGFVPPTQEEVEQELERITSAAANAERDATSRAERRALEERRAADLEKSPDPIKQIEGLRIQLKLLAGE